MKSLTVKLPGIDTVFLYCFWVGIISLFFIAFFRASKAAEMEKNVDNRIKQIKILKSTDRIEKRIEKVREYVESLDQSNCSENDIEWYEDFLENPHMASNYRGSFFHANNMPQGNQLFTMFVLSLLMITPQIAKIVIIVMEQF